MPAEPRGAPGPADSQRGRSGGQVKCRQYKEGLGDDGESSALSFCSGPGGAGASGRGRASCSGTREAFLNSAPSTSSGSLTAPSTAAGLGTSRDGSRQRGCMSGLLCWQRELTDQTETGAAALLLEQQRQLMPGQQTLGLGRATAKDAGRPGRRLHGIRGPSF